MKFQLIRQSGRAYYHKYVFVCDRLLAINQGIIILSSKVLIRLN